MATGGAELLPTKEKTNYLRLALLVIDGGGLALKTQFDLQFPSQSLGQDLQSHGNYQILNDLKRRKILKKDQFDLLFPPPPKIADSSKFDVSLLSCLIQNLPVFNQHTSPVWKQPGPPAPTDLSLAADVKRLRLLRNQVSHASSAALSDQEFQHRWQEASKVIVRLCATIPGIQNDVANSLQLSIDTVKENELYDRIKHLADSDQRLEKVERDFEKLQGIVNIHEDVIGNMKATMDETSKEVEQEKKKIDAIQSNQEMLRGMSSEFKGLMSRSTIYFEEEESNTFIETGSYKTAAETFGKTKVLVLSGHPGEGKTTMAKTLLLKQFLPGRCINITEPSDWKYIDFSLNLIDGILIDDIFGSGVLDENLVKEWERKLNDLSRIGKEKGISIILTSRHYIIEETKQIVRTLPLFKKENIHILSSKDLTEEEKMQILKSHIKANSRKTNQEELLLCILRHSLILESSPFETDGFMFGFPQCVNLFTKQDDLFERGADFFGNPNSFFKTCIQELYRDQEKFLALIVLWANEGQHLSKSELDASHLSQHVKKVAIKFQGELEGKLIKNLRKSLDHHVGGLLHFSKEAGVYKFSHNVISDMVGFVIVEENPDDFLEFCTREFLLMYTTTNSTDDDLKFCIEEHLYKDLIKCFVDIMINNHSVEGLIECDTSLFELCRGGKMRNVVVPTFKYDFSVIKHDSFRNQKFVDCFLAFLTDNRHLETLFGQELMVMSGFFLKYGIHIDQQNYFLLSYAVYLKADVLAERIIVNNLLNKTELSKEEISIEYTLALLFAVHHQLHDAVKLLVETQASVSEEAIYIAAHRTDLDILKLLLGVKDRNSLKNMKILNGNNALIVAAKKGFSDAVKCLIDFGYSLDVRNNDGMSALDKAVAFKQESVCELLANAGASINIKTKKFNRTPLHTAADLGLQTAIKSLLTKGALVKMKDHKGFFPIHSAALNGHIDVVKLLIEHNPEQAGFRTKTYGEKSVLKGKTIFHIALYKKDYTLLEALLATKANPNVTDLYGRTPFFEAVSSGDAKAIQLLNCVAELNNHDKNGFTPLHVAVYNGYLEVVKLLCSNPSVNVNAQDKYGKTPLHLAALTGRYEIFLHLISYQADWRMITNRGDSLAHIAYRKARNTFRPFDQLTKIDLQCFLHCLLHVTGKSQQLKNLFKDLISAITTSNPGILQECIKDYNGTDRNTVDAQSDKTSLHQTVIDHGAETSEHLTDKCRESIHLIILILQCIDKEFIEFGLNGRIAI